MIVRKGTRNRPATRALRAGSLPVLLLFLAAWWTPIAPCQDGSASGLKSTDLRGVLIELAARAAPKVELGPLRAQLAVFELELRPLVNEAKTPRAKAQAVAQYFFKEILLSSDEDLADPENFYAHKVLERRQGYCLSLSAIILAVGRRLKLPLHGVGTPRHFFVRYDDGKTRVNIETTEQGRQRSDDFYRKQGVSLEAERAGVFLANLTDPQVIGYLLNNEGFIHWARGDATLAEKRFEQALALHPKLVEARINLGVVAGDRGQTKKASSHFTEALKWIPADATTWFNRSLNALKGGRYQEALEAVERADLLRGSKGSIAAYRRLVLATVLRPDTWKEYQAGIIFGNEVRRRSGGLAQGLAGRYFSDPSLKKQVATRVDRDIRFEWRWGRPQRNVPHDNFSIRWDGYVDIPTDGIHTFYTLANDGVRVWVDGIRIIDNWKRNEGALDSESLGLKRGLHNLRIDYFEHQRYAGITFHVKSAGAAAPLPPSRYFHARE